MVHSWCLGETREKGGEGPMERVGVCGGDSGGVATMTTDGGGSKQMSTSWQTRPKVVKSLRDRWVSRKHRGATA